MVSIYKLEADFVPYLESLDLSPHAIWRTDRPVRDRRGWCFERKRVVHSAGNDGRLEVKPYNAAIAATVRAFARLEKRGMVKRWRRDAHAAAGIVLTPAGYQSALAHLKELDPDRYQRVMCLLQ